MSRPAAVKLGPFTGGLNIASDPTSIADNDLVECFNFELDLDGSLTCRPPIVEISEQPVAGVTDTVSIIGKATIAGDNLLIGNFSGVLIIYDGTSWVPMPGSPANIESVFAIQYQDLVFVVATPNSVANGGYYNGVTWTTDANMPRGEAAVFHKQRMFVVPGKSATGAGAHQLKFTDPISITAPVPLVWTPTNLIPVGQGDGENLVDIAIHNDNLLLFKQDSTHAFAFDSDPAEGILRKINNNIGSSGLWCVVQYENSIFVFHEGRVFEVVNYDFQQINIKVPFELDETVPDVHTRVYNIYMAILGNRIIVRYFNHLYVYNLKTKTWSRWTSTSDKLQNIGRPVEYPAIEESYVNREYYMGSCMNAEANVFRIKDRSDSTIEQEFDEVPIDIVCTMLTKNFDAQDSHHYKRLMWWGADLQTTREISAVASPIVASFMVTWDQLANYTWDQLLTWDSPLNAIPTMETEVAAGGGRGRVFVKFLKSLRWRQINYRITLVSNGAEPARLFSLTVIVGTKETVVRQVS